MLALQRQSDTEASARRSSPSACCSRAWASCRSRTSRTVMRASVRGWTCKRVTVMLTGTQTPSWLVRR